jgi:hypothetical protein
MPEKSGTGDAAFASSTSKNITDAKNGLEIAATNLVLAVGFAIGVVLVLGIALHEARAIAGL